jgi:hypothetical protein
MSIRYGALRSSLFGGIPGISAPAAAVRGGFVNLDVRHVRQMALVAEIDFV